MSGWVTTMSTTWRPRAGAGVVLALAAVVCRFPSSTTTAVMTVFVTVRLGTVITTVTV